MPGTNPALKCRSQPAKSLRGLSTTQDSALGTRHIVLVLRRGRSAFPTATYLRIAGDGAGSGGIGVDSENGGASMGSDRSQSSNVTEVVLDYATRMKKAEMDRRQFFLRAIAAGATAPAMAAGLRARGVAASASARQDDAAGLVTVSQEQQQTWIKNFNPFLSESAVRWPTHCGIYEPLLIFNVATGETVPWLATAWSWSEDNLTLTFTIRDGVTWSDGTAFTAGDV